jgi:hypothetical protein
MKSADRDYSRSWGRGQKRGLANEKSIVRKLNYDKDYRDNFYDRLGVRGAGPSRPARRSTRGKLSCGGPGTSPTKADFILLTSPSVGVSVKLSKSGQLDARSPKDLIKYLYIQEGLYGDEDVLEALGFFAGAFGPKDHPTWLPLSAGGNTPARYSVGDLYLYKPELIGPLYEWLNHGLLKITRFVFSKGATTTGHATNLLYYKRGELDKVCSVEDIVASVEKWLRLGNRVQLLRDRSTISVPFGSIGASGGKVVFTHDFTKLRDLGVSFR